MRDRVTSSSRAQAIGRLASLADRLARPRRAVPVPEPATVRRIVVVKPCCLGDLLMATPALRALARHYPQAQIDVVTTPWSAPALAGSPHVAEVIPYPDPMNPAALRTLARELRGRTYDLGISLDRSPVVNGLLRLSGTPIRAGIDNQHRGVGLTHRAAPEPGQHETTLFLAVLSTLGVPTQGVEPEYHVSAAARERVQALLGDIDRPLAVIHPGGAVNPGTTMLSKRWPGERFGALAARLHREAGCQIALVGAASDREAVEEARRAANVHVLDFCGRLDLPEVAALSERAALYIGNDSGTTHLAAAAGAPVVAIFGPTSPRRYRPLAACARVCAPPASWALDGDPDLRAGGLPDPALDIAQVTVDAVFAACRELLGCPA